MLLLNLPEDESELARIGIAEGKLVVPDDFDADNAMIENTFMTPPLLLE